jgi:hypothetical protein
MRRMGQVLGQCVDTSNTSICQSDMSVKGYHVPVSCTCAVSSRLTWPGGPSAALHSWRVRHDHLSIDAEAVVPFYTNYWYTYERARANLCLLRR